MISANKTLTDGNFKDVWKTEISKYQKTFERSFVLIDPPFLGEVLKNIFNNVRHNFESYEVANGHSYSSMVKTHLEFMAEPLSEPEPDELENVILEVISEGNVFRRLPGECTFVRHRREVKKFGGCLDIKALSEEGQSGTIVTLKLLISRRNTKQFLEI